MLTVSTPANGTLEQIGTTALPGLRGKGSECNCTDKEEPMMMQVWCRHHNILNSQSPYVNESKNNRRFDGLHRAPNQP